VQHGIQEFRPRQPLDRQLSSHTLNQILRELESLRITRVIGGTFKKLPGGTEIAVVQNATTSSAIDRKPFELAIVNVSETETPQWKVRVYASTLAGGESTDLGFALADTPPYLLDAEEGVVQAGLTIDEEGSVSSRWIEIVNELSEDTDTEFYVEIGTVAEQDETFVATNTRYGPIDATICRNWFSNPPTYSVTFFSGAE
jgi:hypothetical protein